MSQFPVLEADVLLLFHISLDPETSILDRVKMHLSPDEITRGNKYIFPEHQRRFFAGRGALRIILGQYLGMDPSVVSFNLGPKGKPALPASLGGKDLSFNLSNSHELAVIGLMQNRDVGVDVELKRSLHHGEAIARHHFAPREMTTLMALPKHLWQAGFFNCWTRKEAFIKVTGEGLSRPLDSFEVSLTPQKTVQLLRVDEKHPPHIPWSLTDFDPGPDYLGAVCVEGALPEVRDLKFDWDAF